MMIAPALRQGLTIHLRNVMVSSSYIRLTRDIMLEMGIPVDISGNDIRIPPHAIKGKDMEVEADWSAASYWYAFVALADRAELVVEGLSRESYQGDAVLPEIFSGFGVETAYIPGGIRLTKNRGNMREFQYDFRENPDLVQTLVVLCGVLDIAFRFTGTQTLTIKETDRVTALCKEMSRLGIQLEADPAGRWIRWDGRSRTRGESSPTIATYQDHRMAMAFAPAAMKRHGLVIEDPGVVHKSYPRFWEDLGSVGFTVQEV